RWRGRRDADADRSRRVQRAASPSPGRRHGRDDLLPARGVLRARRGSGWCARQLGGRRGGVTVRLDGIDLVVFDKDGTIIEFGSMWSGWGRALAAGPCDTTRG